MLLPLLYFIIGSLELVGEFLQNYPLIFSTKLLLMPLLMLYAYRHRAYRPILFLCLGLFFSWWGDIFLMIRHNYSETTSKLFFIIGLGSFLVAHLQYSICFIKEHKNSTTTSVVVAKPFLILPFMAFILLLWYILGANLGEMKLPVYCYSIVIMLMAISAFNRKDIVSNTSYLMVFIGSLLFMFSDSCIAISLFKQHFFLDRVLIMATYIIAQFLIIKGYLLAKTNIIP